MSPARRILRVRMLALAKRLGPVGRLLEVGIAGDDPPGANREFFTASSYETADCDPATKPDHLFDLTAWEAFPADLEKAFDLVLCSQTLEHVWDFRAALGTLHRLTKPGGYCIVDTPLMYPPHDGDFWRFTPTALNRLCTEWGFAVIDISADTEWLVVSALCQRPT